MEITKALGERPAKRGSGGLAGLADSDALAKRFKSVDLQGRADSATVGDGVVDLTED